MTCSCCGIPLPACRYWMIFNNEIVLILNKLKLTANWPHPVVWRTVPPVTSFLEYLMGWTLSLNSIVCSTRINPISKANGWLLYLSCLIVFSLVYRIPPEVKSFVPANMYIFPTELKYLKNKHYATKMQKNFFFIYSLRQCAAVRTHFDDIMLPPQKCRQAIFSNETWYGARPSGAFLPPTIREESGGCPTSKGKCQQNWNSAEIIRKDSTLPVKFEICRLEIKWNTPHKINIFSCILMGVSLRFYSFKFLEFFLNFWFLFKMFDFCSKYLIYFFYGKLEQSVCSKFEQSKFACHGSWPP